MTDRVIDITNIRRGTYVRQPDGANLLFHSPVTWNDPVFALKWWIDGRTTSSLSEWTQVYGAEAEAVHRAYHLKPGEYVVEEQ